MKTTLFVNEIARLYDKLNSLNNEYTASVEALMEAYELSSPVNASEVAALSRKQRGLLLSSLSSAIAVIGGEVDSDTWINNLMEVDAVYTSLEDVKADVPNIVNDSDSATATVNIEKLEALTDAVNNAFESSNTGTGDIVFDILSTVIIIKEILVDTVANFHRL